MVPARSPTEGELAGSQRGRCVGDGDAAPGTHQAEQRGDPTTDRYHAPARVSHNLGVGRGARRSGATDVAATALALAGRGCLLSVGPRLHAHHDLSQIVAVFAHLGHLGGQTGLLFSAALLKNVERGVVGTRNGVAPDLTYRANARLRRISVAPFRRCVASRQRFCLATRSLPRVMLGYYLLLSPTLMSNEMKEGVQ